MWRKWNLSFKKNSKIKKSCLLNSVFFCQPGWNISVFSSLQGGLAASSIYCRACRYFHGHASSFFNNKEFLNFAQTFLIFASGVMRVQASVAETSESLGWSFFQKYRPMFECKNQKIMRKMIKFFVNGKGREKVKKNSKIKKSCLLNSVFFCQPGWNISVFSSLQGGLAASSIYCRACRYFHGHGSSFLTIKHFQMWHKLFLIFTSVLMRVQAKRRFSVLKSWVILFQKYRPMFECKNQKIMCKMIKFFVMRNRPEGGGGSLAVVKEWKINNRGLAGPPAKLSREFFLENQSSKRFCYWN